MEGNAPNTPNTPNTPIKKTISSFHIILFVGLNFIFLNGIIRQKINKFKQEKYRSNVPKFWLNMLKELFIVPFALLLYWLAFTFIIKVILWFITYSINARNMYREQKQMPMNMSMRQFIVKSISKSIFDNFVIDFKIYTMLFMYNIIILVSILLILLFNLKENINDLFIDRLLLIYQILMTFSIIILFRRVNK